MTIGTRHLDRSLRPAKACLQVLLVVQLHLCGVLPSGHYHGKFRVASGKARDRALKSRRCPSCLQIGMTLSAVTVGERRERQALPVLYMTSGAFRREGLVVMVNRPIVAFLAGIVRDTPPEDGGTSPGGERCRGHRRSFNLGRMAPAAIGAEHRVLGGDRPAGVDPLIAPRG